MIGRAKLIDAGTVAARFLPSALARLSARAAADVCWLALGDRRRTIERNLEHIAPALSTAQRRRLSRATFRNLARCTLDVLRLPSMATPELLSLVDSDGREHLDAALERGKGAILVTAHLGNFELGGAWLAALGYPVFAVAEDLEPEVYEAVGRYRRATGMKLLSRDRGAVAAFRSLKRNQLLVLIGDRAIGRGGVPVHFCNGRRPLPVGPATLAARTGAPLIIGYFVLNPAGSPRYVSRFEPVPVSEEGGDESDRIAALTRTVAAHLSRLVQRHPDQWFVFQPEWLPVDG